MEVRIKSPASANLGPCFDCAGIAFPLYNIVNVKNTDDGKVRVIIDEKGDVRTFDVDEKNIIFFQYFITQYQAGLASFRDCFYDIASVQH